MESNKSEMVRYLIGLPSESSVAFEGGVAHWMGTAGAVDPVLPEIGV